MTTIKTTFGAGGANLTPSGSQGEPDLATTLRDIAADFLAQKLEAAVARGNALVVDVTDLRTKLIAVLTALDGDSGVTDTNYAATQSPAAITAVAGVSASTVMAQLNALVADLAAIRAKITGLTTKLDADAGVTDVNYGALWPAPAATAAVITSTQSVADLVNKLVADRAALRTTLTGICTKLDNDGTVNLTTYAATGLAAAPTAGVLAVLLTIAG